VVALVQVGLRVGGELGARGSWRWRLAVLLTRRFGSFAAGDVPLGRRAGGAIARASRADGEPRQNNGRPDSSHSAQTIRPEAANLAPLRIRAAPRWWRRQIPAPAAAGQPWPAAWARAVGRQSRGALTPSAPPRADPLPPPARRARAPAGLAPRKDRGRKDAAGRRAGPACRRARGRWPDRGQSGHRPRTPARPGERAPLLVAARRSPFGPARA